MSKKPRDAAWMPVAYRKAQIYAIKALAEGKASEGQQKMALDWIISQAAATYDEPYRSNADGGERETSYALGRAFVGRQIVKMINLPHEIINKMKDEQ